MSSKIFTIFLTAGLSVMIVSLYTAPSVDIKIHEELSKSLSGSPSVHFAVIPAKTFADYIPYIGGASAVVGLAEKVVKFFKWLFSKRKN